MRVCLCAASLLVSPCRMDSSQRTSGSNCHCLSTGRLQTGLPRFHLLREGRYDLRRIRRFKGRLSGETLRSISPSSLYAKQNSWNSTTNRTSSWSFIQIFCPRVSGSRKPFSAEPPTRHSFQKHFVEQLRRSCRETRARHCCATRTTVHCSRRPSCRGSCRPVTSSTRRSWRVSPPTASGSTTPLALNTAFVRIECYIIVPCANLCKIYIPNVGQSFYCYGAEDFSEFIEEKLKNSNSVWETHKARLRFHQSVCWQPRSSGSLPSGALVPHGG